ncbi:MAG: DUF4389 domain-containing protein [Saccharospirillum sp.]
MASLNREEKEHQVIRALCMILFWVILRISLLVTAVLAIVQWVLAWFEDNPNPQLVRFCRRLGLYQKQMLDYLTFLSHNKPFPFSDWPDDPTDVQDLDR